MRPRRVCARAPRYIAPAQPAAVAPPTIPAAAADDTLEQARELIEKRDALRARIVAFIRRRGRAYSVEVAEAIGIHYATAKSHLVSLQQLGELDSDYEAPTPGASSGLGRRYYRIAGSAPGATARVLPPQSSATPPAPGADSLPLEVDA